MTRITIRERAPDYESPKGTWPGRFDRDAFASQIGKTVPFTVEGRRYASAALAAAEVDADGTSVLLTFDVADDAEPAELLQNGAGMSFGFHAPPARWALEHDGADVTAVAGLTHEE